MSDLVDVALADPWGTLRTVLDEPLHPGGVAATDDLLDRAGVDHGDRLLDLGCGAGAAVEQAEHRGADPVGLDRAPAADGGHALRGDVRSVPVADDAVDVALAECALCLSPDLDRSLAEVHRVLDPRGRLAMSDVVVAGDVPDVPPELASALCLTGALDRQDLHSRVEEAGFVVRDVTDHRDDLLAMRDRLAERVDYAGLLSEMGSRGEEALVAIERVEDAVEDGRIGYVSLVADVET